MGNLGIGVMLQMLGGNAESVEAWQTSFGKEISIIELKIDVLYITFTDGETLRIADEGQSCCEERWMHSDDDLQAFIGSQLTGAEIREVPNSFVSHSQPDYDDVHDIEFLLIHTSLGTFTIETHNNHNGYYGGFAVQASIV